MLDVVVTHFTHLYRNLKVIHEHIFDKKIVWLSGCHQLIGLFPKRNTMDTCVCAYVREQVHACWLVCICFRDEEQE